MIVPIEFIWFISHCLSLSSQYYIHFLDFIWFISHFLSLSSQYYIHLLEFIWFISHCLSFFFQYYIYLLDFIWFISHCLSLSSQYYIHLLDFIWFISHCLSFILSVPQCKRGNPWFIAVPLKPLSDQQCCWYCCFSRALHSDIFYLFSCITLYLIKFLKSWTLISYSFLTDKAFQGTLVNQALSSLHGGSRIHKKIYF